MIIATVASMLVNDITTSFLPTKKVDCLEDEVLIFFEPLNTYLKNNTTIKNLIVASTGLGMDVLLVAGLYHWCLYGRSWRYPFSITCLYALRTLLVVTSINKF
jgi:hypothetical protein